MTPYFAPFPRLLVSECEMGTYECGAPWSSFVFADGKIVAGQILGSVRVVHEAVLDAHSSEDTVHAVTHAEVPQTQSENFR